MPEECLEGADCCQRVKPRPEYGSLLFVGNYVATDLPGFYMSYYFTKNRSLVMQVHYTNPGNMNGVMLFSKDT